MDRAYSLLTLKSVDDAKRIITGIASTIATDRQDDIVEPKGAQFNLPIPFLWQHDSAQPIGQVTKATVTAGKIEVEVQLAQVMESGLLKDRLDEAWQSIKAGLVRGMSIGFKSLETDPIAGSFGVRFKKWLWLELSAVTIPANHEATILSVKSIDREARAASGDIERAVVRLLQHPGVSGPHTPTTETKDSEMKTVSEQIVDLQNTRAAKAARLSEVTTKSMTEGTTMDAADTEEFDRLADEIKRIDSDLGRLEILKGIQVSTAVAAAGTSTATAAAARASVPATVRTIDKSEPGINFARWAMCLGRAHGNVELAANFAKQYYGQIEPLNMAFKGLREMGPNTFAKGLVEKAAVSAAQTTDATWAGPLVAYNQFAGDFIEFLRPMSIIGKFGSNGIPALNRIPFNVHIRGATSGGAGYWVGQGKAKPLTKFDFNDTYLGFTKLANICVLTEETMRFTDPAAETLVRRMMADAIIARMDADFIDPTNAGVSGVKPASITYGATTAASAGSTAANIRADIATLWGTAQTANLSADSAVYITNMATALRLSLQQTALGTPQFPGMTMRGGTLDGIPVIVSNYLPTVSAGSYLVLVFANEIWLADDGQVNVSASTEASLEMSDAPASNSGTPTPATMVSMFQTDSVALRAERYINWAKRRASAVTYLTGVNYSA